MTEAFETASWGRRALALIVDWLVCTLVVVSFVGPESYGEPGSPASFYVVGLYVVESALFTWLVGGSFGKLATGLRVVPESGRLRPLNPLVLLMRQVMVALVIPALVFRPDGRGLHDLAAGTATVKRDVFDAMVGRARG